MSQIIYNGWPNTPRWCADTAMFLIAHKQQGPLATREITKFAASCAAAVLGPDLKMSGQEETNAPSVGGPPWDTPLNKGPAETFAGDRRPGWIRGHLVNGRWHGRGDTWQNLVPLTSVANTNHATVEGYIDNYLLACHRYEDAAHRDDWYGVYYCVQASANPFSDPSVTNPKNLYSYAPEFIRITWRAVRIAKPHNVSPTTALNSIDSYPLHAVPQFPQGFVLPVLPTVMKNTYTLPSGNTSGQAVLGSLPTGLPTQQSNGFDNWIEIHQSAP